ncbi:MAG: hypothetical protein IJQ56_11530, partial [Synergistaceae bacterium]|nr:hypothetical protein [Synergistaceae bacterium]
MNFRKIFISLLLILLVSASCTHAATRRRTTQQQQNQQPQGTQAQSGNGDAMTPEEEESLIEAAEAMKLAGLVQFNFKDMDLVRFMRFMSEI